jgi:hypothetical protein
MFLFHVFMQELMAYILDLTAVNKDDEDVLQPTPPPMTTMAMEMTMTTTSSGLGRTTPF